MLQVRLLLKNVEFSLKLSKIIIFHWAFVSPKYYLRVKLMGRMNYIDHLLNKKYYSIDIFSLLVSK